MLVHAARTAQQLLVEFWTPVGWLPYLPDLNQLDFTIWRVLQAISQASPHTNLDSLRQSIAAEWDWLAAEDICKTYCSFCHCWQTVTMNKIKLKLNVLAANSPTYTNQYFSGLP